MEVLPKNDERFSKEKKKKSNANIPDMILGTTIPVAIATVIAITIAITVSIAVGVAIATRHMRDRGRIRHLTYSRGTRIRKWHSGNSWTGVM